MRTSVATLVWQSPGSSENHERIRRGRCPHRPVNVPLEISADMFLLAGAALEAQGMTYANYKIRLEAELLDENRNAISGSNASDYLVYTNSRIYKNIIPRT